DAAARGSAAGFEQGSVREQKGIPEILVKGSKNLNMDIQRTANDPQPWVVFDREEIQQSGAAEIQEFLKTRLTMDTNQQSANQSPANIPGNVSTIKRGGLGSSQTLVLVDGRRVPTLIAANGTTPSQADLNGIALAAVERIEVLPSTASGIYGGGATGG